MKLNLLPPALRERKRYLVFEIISEKNIEYEDFRKVLNAVSLRMFGELTTAKMKFWVIRNLYSSEKGRGVVKVRRDYVEQLRFCLALIRKINNVEVIVHVVGLTGTIDAAEKKYLED